MSEAHQSPQPPIVPIAYAGKWLAWNQDETQIVATGRTLLEAKQAAEQAGEQQPVLVKAPPADVRFVG